MDPVWFLPPHVRYNFVIGPALQFWSVNLLPLFSSAFSEIFASITGLEYAFTKAPKRMRSLVMSLFLFTNAIAAAIGEAMNPLASDPLLVCQYSSHVYPVHALHYTL